MNSVRLRRGKIQEATPIISILIPKLFTVAFLRDIKDIHTRLSWERTMIRESSSRVEREKKLNDELGRIVAKLKKTGVKKVILFGSLATGNVGSCSDIDLVVIKETKKRFLDRLELLYEDLTPSVALDILCYTPEEVEEMLKWSSFLNRVLEEGEVLYEA